MQPPTVCQTDVNQNRFYGKKLNALAAYLDFDSCNAFNVKKFSPGNSKAPLHRKRLKVLKQILGRSEKQNKI